MRHGYKEFVSVFHCETTGPHAFHDPCNDAVLYSICQHIRQFLTIREHIWNYGYFLPMGFGYGIRDKWPKNSYSYPFFTWGLCSKTPRELVKKVRMAHPCGANIAVSASHRALERYLAAAWCVWQHKGTHRQTLLIPLLDSLTFPGNTNFWVHFVSSAFTVNNKNNNNNNMKQYSKPMMLMGDKELKHPRAS